MQQQKPGNRIDIEHPGIGKKFLQIITDIFHVRRVRGPEIQQDQGTSHRFNLRFQGETEARFYIPRTGMGSFSLPENRPRTASVPGSKENGEEEVEQEKVVAAPLALGRGRRLLILTLATAACLV